jgi:hypothetical protein
MLVKHWTRNVNFSAYTNKELSECAEQTVDEGAGQEW